MNNIYLIGMPGCGKSTIGKNTAEKADLSYIDLDDYITKNQNMNINEIFEKYGEEYFRDIETNSLKNVSQNINYLISTGGGIVLKNENIEIMKKTGFIIFIDTPVEFIISHTDFSDRPLLKDNIEKIHSLYDERYVKYLACSDKVICDTDINNCTDEIMNFILHPKGK